MGLNLEQRRLRHLWLKTGHLRRPRHSLCVMFRSIHNRQQIQVDSNIVSLVCLWLIRLQRLLYITLSLFWYLLVQVHIKQIKCAKLPLTFHLSYSTWRNLFVEFICYFVRYSQQLFVEFFFTPVSSGTTRYGALWHVLSPLWNITLFIKTTSIAWYWSKNQLDKIISTLRYARRLPNSGRTQPNALHEDYSDLDRSIFFKNLI